MRFNWNDPRLLGKNKYEVYPALILTLSAIITSHTDMGYRDDVIQSGVGVIALVCAINAFRDRDRINQVEQGLSIAAMILSLALIASSLG